MACPAARKLYFGVVDVRDVADLHLRAMTNPAAKGERFIAVSGDVHVDARHRDGAQGAPGTTTAKKVPTRQLPNWVVRLAARFDPGDANVAADAREDSQCDEREGRARARMETAIARGCDRGHG